MSIKVKKNSEFRGVSTQEHFGVRLWGNQQTHPTAPAATLNVNIIGRDIDEEPATQNVEQWAELLSGSLLRSFHTIVERNSAERTMLLSYL